MQGLRAGSGCFSCVRSLEFWPETLEAEKSEPEALHPSPTKESHYIPHTGCHLWTRRRL